MTHSTEELAARFCVANAPKLSDAELAAYLDALPGWSRAGNALEKEFRFPDFARTIAFVNSVASLAEREDHHPDLGVHYGRCTVTWSTHSAGGITLNDVICAAKVEGLRL
jgi:4a-hydroxytetrahydrobiopterin dehydratase